MKSSNPRLTASACSFDAEARSLLVSPLNPAVRVFKKKQLMRCPAAALVADAAEVIIPLQLPNRTFIDRRGHNTNFVVRRYVARVQTTVQRAFTACRTG